MATSSQPRSSHTWRQSGRLRTWRQKCRFGWRGKLRCLAVVAFLLTTTAALLRLSLGILFVAGRSSRPGQILVTRKQQAAELPSPTAPAQGPQDTTEYRRLSQREHVLLRPDTYIGGVAPRAQKTWVLRPDGLALEEIQMTYSPGFLKIFDEILVNAMDQQFEKPRKGSRKKTTHISVNVDSEFGVINVTNDGVGIPVEYNKEYNAWVPSFIFGELLTGSNFDDNAGPRFVGGRNGIGAKAANIFSKIFQVRVIDPASRRVFTQTWRDNMAMVDDPDIQKVDEKPPTGQVSIEFIPDFLRFGMRGLDALTVRLLKARVLDVAACTRKDIQVSFNEEKLDVRTFDDYARLVFGPVNHTTTIIKDNGPNGLVRLEVAAGVSNVKGFRSVAFVNGIRCNAGTHVDSVVRQLVMHTKDHIRKSITRQEDGDVRPQQFVKDHLFVVVKALVENPSFDSQNKDSLATPEAEFGFDTQLPQAFLNKVIRLGLAQAAMDYASFKADAQSTAKLKKQVAGRHLSLPKLDDAEYAGVRGHNCTLILTEGDSAKAMALGALESIQGSRAHFGIFPLKGKLLNVQKASTTALANAEGVKELMQALGLTLRGQYTSIAAPRLRYQKIMVFADQDPDGDHITGLIMNFISHLWPSIFKVDPKFVVKFATPLVKVLNHPGIHFYSMQEWETWSAKKRSPQPIPKYYKGLGTSSDKEAAEYFQNLEKNTLAFDWKGDSDNASLKLAFQAGPGAADARKQWLLHTYDPDAFLDYSQSAVSHSEFFTKSFIHFSMYMNQRSIPSLMDGFKTSQRKAMCVALRGLKSETKVTVFSNLVMAKMNYHHGDMSMTETIVRLAQNHVGSNNVNFLRPHGQFGSRLHERGEHAQARYIGVALEPIARKIFRSEDDAILEYQWDEASEVEPNFLLPVVPAILLNGASGIGTGWSVDMPNYHPLDVIAATKEVLAGNHSPQLLMPWYDGFSGEIFKHKGRFISAGVWKVGMSDKRKTKPDIIEITELPVGTWTEDYKVKLLQNSALQGMMKKIDTSQNGKASVHIRLLCDPTKLESFLRKHKGDWELGRALGLIKRIPSMMWLWNATGKLEYFDDTDGVIRSFFATRLPKYERRLQHLQETARHEVEKTRSRLDFIQCVVNGTLQLMPAPPAAELRQQMRQRGFKPLRSFDARGRPAGEADFDHLLKMTFTSFTRETYEELAQRLLTREAHLRELEGKTARDLWAEDLEELEEAYEIFFAERRQTMPARTLHKDLHKVISRSCVREFIESDKVSQAVG
eukprot:TRINITY_DN74453_c0_g1_i1.p1 TRINITY_DN74453_c0_g1~~TRINITY_DN74453_c0_g1_i1.p1  ORF type:complete len:1272 (-),score=223.30 TRINITY_DN74453_c0_g1_i1:29-3844(-)